MLYAWYNNDMYYNSLEKISYIKNITQMLEIGIYSGASLSMWLKYLSNCFIWGMDINKEEQGERFHNIRTELYYHKEKRRL